MVFTNLLSVRANLAIFYVGISVGTGLLVSGFRNKRHMQCGCALITLLAAVSNYQYGFNDVGEMIAFFNTVYDPFHNVGLGNGTMDDFPGLARCNGGHNRCTLLDDYEYHAAWATTLYTRFSDGADAVLNRAKLTAHAWLNTTAFIICLVQMHGPTRKKYLDLHRKMGWAAIALVTCGTGCSLWLASDHGDLEYYGGNVAVAGWFISVAGTLFGTLIPGVLAVLRKDIAGHKKWMTRFYGSMWGAFLVFRLMFLVGRLMAWHKNAMILINIWTCTPIGVLLAEVVRVRSLATDTKTASRRGTMETVDSSSSVKND